MHYKTINCLKQIWTSIVFSKALHCGHLRQEKVVFAPKSKTLTIFDQFLSSVFPKYTQFGKFSFDNC